MRQSPRILFAIAAVLPMLAAGCGPEVHEADSTARGVVMLDGKPLTGGVVMFFPGSGEGQGGSGMIQPDGTFEVRTNASTTGIDPGTYIVVIKPTDDMEDGGGIPAKYQDAENAEFSAEVTAQGPNEFSFVLTSG
ncbi:MAG: hypothetical protein R3B90_01285 [Planctomycetaceae bacterium]